MRLMRLLKSSRSSPLTWLSKKIWVVSNLAFCWWESRRARCNCSWNAWIRHKDQDPIYVFLWCYHKIWKIALFTNKKTYLQIPNSFDFFFSFFLSFFLSFSRKKKKWATVGQRATNRLHALCYVISQRERPLLLAL